MEFENSGFNTNNKNNERFKMGFIVKRDVYDLHVGDIYKLGNTEDGNISLYNNSGKIGEIKYDHFWELVDSGFFETCDVNNCIRKKVEIKRRFKHESNDYFEVGELYLLISPHETAKTIYFCSDVCYDFPKNYVTTLFRNGYFKIIDEPKNNNKINDKLRDLRNKKVLIKEGFNYKCNGIIGHFSEREKYNLNYINENIISFNNGNNRYDFSIDDIDKLIESHCIEIIDESENDKIFNKQENKIDNKTINKQKDKIDNKTNNKQDNKVNNKQEDKVNKQKDVKNKNNGGSNMFNFKGLFKDFGKITDGSVAMTFNGQIAIKRNDNEYIRYNDETKTMENQMDLVMKNVDSLFYIIPVTNIIVGDVIKYKSTYYQILSIDKDIKAVNIKEGSKKTIIKETNIMGFNFYYKVINLFSQGNFMNNTTTGINPMMLMMLQDNEGENKEDNSDNDNMINLMLMQSMGNSFNGNNTGNNNIMGGLNPMMLMMLNQGDEKMDMKNLMLMNMFGNFNQQNQSVQSEQPTQSVVNNISTNNEETINLIVDKVTSKLMDIINQNNQNNQNNENKGE